MKKVISLITTFIIITTCITTSVFAEGSGNMDSGSGGGTGSGTSTNKWSVGDEGVRASIIEIATQKTVKEPIDFTNESRKDIDYHFGKSNKIMYRKGAKLRLYDDNYKYKIPPKKMPEIIDYKGSNDIGAIKKYFTSEPIIKFMASTSKIPYDDLISGRYKLLLEPIVYLTYRGNRIAMTSHQAAMYNEKLGNNDLIWKFQSITHRALPFAMFLQKSDLGFPAYTGKTNTPQKDSTIKSKLGLGIVRFKPYVPPTPPKEPEPPKPDIDVDTNSYSYRTDTDVITSLKINSKTDIGHDNDISVTFNILGEKYTVKDIVIPKNENQIVWVRWHTPKTPQEVNINVSISGANVKSASIKAKVEKLEEVTPPDPKPTDRNDLFNLVNLPQDTNKTSATWSKWSCEWISKKETVTYGYDEDGNPLKMTIDKGYNKYSETKYSADLNAILDLVPGLRTPTAIEKNNEYEMKSGYGVNAKVKADVSYNCSEKDVTSVQNVTSTFSDFKYKTYNRLLEKTSSKGLNSIYEFKKNKYSTYNDRTHFTPIWYPDKTNYIVNAQILDVWTPVGMLQANLNDKIYINGNLHQDRHIAILK